MNSGQPPCSTCQKPTALTKRNCEAWEVFCDLDTFGRDVDTMGGFPLNLRQEAISRACRHTSDPRGIEWRVKEYDRTFTKFRREEAKRQRDEKE